MQKGAAASLVRSPALLSLYANQPHLLEDPNLIYSDPSDVQPHTLPTPKQQAALDELLSFDNEKILAWLTLLRSIEPGFRYQAGRGCLSNQQLEALSTLRDCGDSDILAWLTLSFRTSDFNGQRTLSNTISTFRSPVVPISRHLRQPSTNLSLRSSTSSFAPSAVFSSNSNYCTPRSSGGSLGYGIPLPELPEGIACGDESNHAHWCTYREHSRPINKCEGWKRHEREHETGYLCMPHGPVEPTQNGLICALCGKADPDADHLAWHNISSCFGKFGVPLKKSRRSDMVRHLALHRVHSKVGEALTDRWRYDSKKKYFSCGLCIMIFISITDRLNHIDNEHWRYGQNMGAWELSNSIRGLLLEPEVQAAWRALLRSHPLLVASNLRWEMPLAEGLQLRLEMGKEPALVLAKAALELSNYEWIRSSQEGSMATTGREEMSFDKVSTAPRSPGASMVVHLSNSTYQPLSNHTRRRAPLSRLLPGSLSSSNVQNSSTEFPNPQYDLPLSPTAFLNDSFQLDYLYNDTFSHPAALMDPNASDTPSQQSNSACSTEWPSMDTSQPLNNNTRIQGHLIESGASLVAQMSSSRYGQSVTIDRQGPISDSRNDINSANTVRLPTSNFFHGWTPQLSNHEHGFNFRKKPLPPVPLSEQRENASRAAERRPSTPMDLGTG